MTKTTLLYTLILFLLLSCDSSESNSKTSVNSNEKDRIPNLEKATVVSYQNLDAVEFKTRINESSDAVIIDVRTPEETAKGKISGAIELNFYDADIIERILSLERDKPYYVYCEMGSRSSKIARIMAENGFSNVNNLKGGYISWSSQ